MMVIAYYSKTGKVRSFTKKLEGKGFICKDIMENHIIEDDFILITPTYGLGSVPKEVELFLRDNSTRMIAVASSGNRVWGNHVFAKSGETISKQYNVPLLHQFQSQGFNSDVDYFIERVFELGKMD